MKGREAVMRHRVLALLLVSFVLGQGSSYAQSPSPERLFELGMNALSGVGSGRDEQGALGYLRHSADLGYPPAEVLLGYFYDTGTIITRDPGQAASWYKKAAQQDDPVGGVAARPSDSFKRGPARPERSQPLAAEIRGAR